MTSPSQSSSRGSELRACGTFDDPSAPPNATEAPHGTMNGQGNVIDAGLKSLDHYKRALPKWRYDLRQAMLPLVRWETPYLAYFQNKLRTPALDSYFAITANLGTHTFFMIGLPIIFWCGSLNFGRGLVHILAEGVFFSGFIKDLCSLPRPLSPPLHRITMSGSVALEYGFPSTHSANAVSVAVYALLILRTESNPFSATTTLALEALCYCYALSIVVGRLYCGMHGFLDVLVGSLLGAAISLVEFHYAPVLEQWMHASTWAYPLLAALIIIVLVRVHPEPADDCPCFDDSVAFAGVVIGLEIGSWHFWHSRWSYIYNGPDKVFDLASLGWPVAVARIVLGVLIVFAWREVMKPALLKILPHAFRIIETQGLSLPRRFFTPATAYKDVPLRQRDDNVLPNVSDFPKLVRSIRGPGRGRSISIGPQSAADAYETLAYRERRRRESMGSDDLNLRSKAGAVDQKDMMDLNNSGTASTHRADPRSRASGIQRTQLDAMEQLMGQGTVVINETTEDNDGSSKDIPEIYVGRQDELGEKEMFEKLVKPRVRYDVEVVTKLVVYTGIGWLSVDLILLIFEFVGLGAGHLGKQ